MVQNLRSVKITDVAGVSNRLTNWRQHELPFFSEEVVGVVAQSHRHLNPGSVSFFGGLSFQ